ncbi:MAG: lysophospholipid acyltransferase family protein [Planctomycetota bacterium]|nr:lysophospholipid acyltransferase family protein [Planctomycetota bacterium]
MKTTRNKTVDFCVYLLVRTIVCVIQALPIKVCDQFAKFLAWIAVDVFKIRAKLIDQNLSSVFPSLPASKRREITKSMWRHLCLMAFEIAHAPRKIHETNWRHFFTVPDGRAIVGSLLLNRPKTLVSGHYGNFELGGFMAGLLGFPGYTVARTMDNQFIDKFVKQFREAQGQYILDTTGSSKAIQEQLENNQCLTLLGDQHTELGAVWVEFMGRAAACHKSLAVFTLSCDSPMVVVYTKRVKKYPDSRESEPMQFEIGCNGIIDPRKMPEEINGVKDLTLWYNQRLEEIILADPEHYWWVHNRWKPKPERKKRKISNAKAA